MYYSAMITLILNLHGTFDDVLQMYRAFDRTWRQRFNSYGAKLVKAENDDEGVFWQIKMEGSKLLNIWETSEHWKEAYINMVGEKLDRQHAKWYDGTDDNIAWFERA